MLKKTLLAATLVAFSAPAFATSLPTPQAVEPPGSTNVRPPDTGQDPVRGEPRTLTSPEMRTGGADRPPQFGAEAPNRSVDAHNPGRPVTGEQTVPPTRIQ